MADVQARLVPFHCSVEPPVAPADDNYAENEIMEPFCAALLDRKRRFEQNVRWRFNHDNTGLAEGEELLMERLRIVRAHSMAFLTGAIAENTGVVPIVAAIFSTKRSNDPNNVKFPLSEFSSSKYPLYGSMYQKWLKVVYLPKAANKFQLFHSIKSPLV